MRAVVQRVGRSEVNVAGRRAGEISSGLLVYLGVSRDDSETDVAYLVNKVLGLRVFPDENGVMNRSIVEVASDSEAGSDTPGILVISQFTLFGDVRKGRRPSYNGAAPPDLAARLYELTAHQFAESGIAVATGVFQEHMHVSSTNDGPVTILIDSKKEF